MSFCLGQVEEDLALPQQAGQSDRSRAPWVLEVDVPEPVLVQVADGDPLGAGVFLEAKVGGQAFAGDVVARNVTDDNAEPMSEQKPDESMNEVRTVSYTHLRAHETRHDLVCRLLLEKKKKKKKR